MFCLVQWGIFYRYQVQKQTKEVISENLHQKFEYALKNIILCLSVQSFIHLFLSNAILENLERENVKTKQHKMDSSV